MAPTAAPAAGFSIRVRADRSGGEAARDADLPGAPAGTWPFRGVEFVDTFQKVTAPPKTARAAAGFIQRGLAGGWIEAEGHKVVTRPAGTAADPWAPTPTAPTPHIFHHYEVVILKGMDGDVRYRVTHQPDKYAADGGDDTPVTDEVYASGDTRVDWFYDLEMEG